MIPKIYLSSSKGTSYVFSLYGPSIQSLMSYSQSQIGLVAISGNAGVFLLGPFWGYLCDHYPDKTVSFFVRNPLVLIDILF